MYCAHCGASLPPGTTTCASCGFTTKTPSPGRPGAAHPDSVDQVIHETEDALRALAAATETLSKRVASHAETFAKDASGTTRKGLERLKKEVHTAVSEISDALEKL